MQLLVASRAHEILNRFDALGGRGNRSPEAFEMRQKFRARDRSNRLQTERGGVKAVIHVMGETGGHLSNRAQSFIPEEPLLDVAELEQSRHLLRQVESDGAEMRSSIDVHSKPEDKLEFGRTSPLDQLRCLQRLSAGYNRQIISSRGAEKAWEKSLVGGSDPFFERYAEVIDQVRVHV